MLGTGRNACPLPELWDWTEIEALAEQHGLLAIVVDGIAQLPEDKRPPKEVLLQWIGITMQDESRFAIQQKVAAEMASLFQENYIRTYVLKGDVVAECYPKPEHRVSSDMDCFLLPEKGDFDAWELGNDLIKSKGFEVSDGFYKNSSFYLTGLTVENHKYMTPFRGNGKLKSLEVFLQGMIREDGGQNRFEGTCLYKPPVMMTALFLIEHAYSHFLHEGLTWRQVLDWAMFCRKHNQEIDWYSFGAMIDEFGFGRFYNSYVRMGQYLLGEIDEDTFSKPEKRMLADLWAPLDLQENLHSLKAKIGMAMATVRAWWKYHFFSPISMPRALWIQVNGFLFMKHPTLE